MNDPNDNLSPKVLRFLRGTPAWKDWRSGKDLDGYPRINETAAAVISDRCHWKTIHRLWKEHLGIVPPLKPNVLMESAFAHQNEAMTMYQRHTGIRSQAIFVEHPEIPWAIASVRLSLDGKVVIMPKSPGRRIMYLARAGKVMDYHWAAVQWQLMCCPSATEAHYWAYETGSANGINVQVMPDQSFQKTLLEKATQFRSFVARGIPPPGDEWAMLARRWRSLRDEMDSDQLTLDALSDQLTNLIPPGEDLREGLGVRASRHAIKGQIDLELAFKQLNVQVSKAQLEPFRKPTTVRTQVAKVNLPPGSK